MSMTGLSLYLFLIAVPVRAGSSDLPANAVLVREPLLPEPGKQYRLAFDSPAKSCSAFLEAKPVLTPGELLVSSVSRDTDVGCHRVWVISGAESSSPFLPWIELRVAGKSAFRWARKPESLGEVVWQTPGDFVHSNPCPQFRAKDYSCLSRKTGDSVRLPFGVEQSEAGGYEVVWENDRLVFNHLNGTKTPIEGKVIDFTRLAELPIAKEERLFRCQAGQLKMENFFKGEQGSRTIWFEGEKLRIKGEYLGVNCKTAVASEPPCQPGTYLAQEVEMDLECSRKTEVSEFKPAF
jgi:hypothetical protein